MLDEGLLGGRTTGTEIKPVVMVRGPDEVENAFTTMVAERADAVVVQGTLAVKPVTDMAIKYRLPTASTTRAFADIGGLMSFGADGPAWCQVCAENITGQAAERYTHRAAHQIRACHQSQDGQGNWPHNSRNVFAACRRVARVNANVRYWPLADIGACAANVRFRG
jgi:hypothetical protein